MTDAMEALRKRISDVDANFLEEVIFKLGPESWSRKWARGKKGIRRGENRTICLLLALWNSRR